MSTRHVELLTKARELYQRDKAGGICCHLKAAASSLGMRYYQAEREIKCHIVILLSPHHYLSGWLMDTHGIEHGELFWYDGTNSERLIATCLAWIDWLIEEWRDAP